MIHTMTNTEQLHTLCEDAKNLILAGDYKACEQLVTAAMERYPHAAQPHNLIGILLEKEGNHCDAMKHFRAAWALDPTYLPARKNLEKFGTFFSGGECAYDESDCSEEPQNTYTVKYDTDGVGHVVRRKRK